MRMGRRSGEWWLEEQNTGMPLVVEQWLEVPKVLPQDRVLETARQIANHLDKRDRMVSSGKSQLEREAGCLNMTENGGKLKSLVDECTAKVMGELQKKKVEKGNQKMMVEECATKFVDELLKKMNIETKVQLPDQTGWTVQGGEQLTVSLGDQDKGTGTRLETIGDIEGSPRNPRARQVWLKMNGKVKAVELRDESAREIEERVRRWMRVEGGMDLYVVSEGRRLSWEGLAEEQQAVQESRMVGKQGKKVGRQGIRWADMEDSQIEIDEKKCFEESREGSETGVERWVSYDMAVEEHEAVLQREEETMKEAEMNREKVQVLVQGKDWGIERREDWENVTEDGSTREAFEPRGSEGFEGQQDGERKTEKGGRDEREKAGKERNGERGNEGEREKGGKERQERGGKERQEEDGMEWQEDGGKGKGRQDKGEEGKEMFGSGRSDDRHGSQDEGGRRRQDDGQVERGKGSVQRRQDDYDDDKRQIEKLADVVRRQLEDGRRQDEGVLGWEDDRRQDEDVMGWAMDVGRKENERSRELGLDSQRVNLEDFFRRYKWEQGEQQQQGRDWPEGESFSCRGSRHFESRGKDGGCEHDERERLKGGIGHGKGMSRGQGKGRGEINEQSWEESWRIKKENWMNEFGGWMERDDLGVGQMKEKWRQEQWEMVRALRLRNDMLRMAECLGEEMASELARVSWRNVRNLRRDRRGEKSGKGLVEQSEDSVDEKIRRLTERIDELEGKDKRREKDRVVKGCSSESDESGEKWSWDGRNWWYKVESKGPVNSRLRRKVARAVAVALEQDSRKWKEGLIQLQDKS